VPMVDSGLARRDDCRRHSRPPAAPQPHHRHLGHKKRAGLIGATQRG
jgi:hypothetical protein